MSKYHPGENLRHIANFYIGCLPGFKTGDVARTVGRVGINADAIEQPTPPDTDVTPKSQPPILTGAPNVSEFGNIAPAFIPDPSPDQAPRPPAYSPGIYLDRPGRRR